ncbi:pseudouridylate synthase [Sulfurisphaera ohwakuensis]|uniref:Pseudouridylate synthase n=1 Tax=Sulfurisphaera ohwakuensis TaxID=69656 RepID=A0A650CHM7_SULOH|nr:pseudouridylate synthase [Sulfurisphaera ohwakuensis]
MQNFLKTEILSKSLELLSKYPLCDSCLGRCFARLSLGHSNEERGKAIKILLLMEIDKAIKEHKIEDLPQIKEVLYNMGEISLTLYKNYFNDEFQNRSCYICDNRINEFKENFLKKALEKIGNNKTFVLGVKLTDELKNREEKFMVENQLFYYESIKNEIKRDVGKKLANMGFIPEFDNPQVELVYDMEYDTVIVFTKSKKYLAFYNRLSRGIPISSWVSKGGESLESLLSTQVVAPYSEASEYRIIDDYPLIIENITEKQVNLQGFHITVVSKIAGKELSTIFTIKPTRRLYRVTVYSDEEIKEGIKIYDKIYDIFIEAKDFKELREKIKNYQVISIDLISTVGKSKLVADTYIKKNFS